MGDVWVHYLAQIANFAGIYYFTYILKRSEWWTVPPYTGGDTDYSHPATTNPWSLWFALIYYSTQTQTLVGFGDIVPLSVIPASAAAAQMFLGILYISQLIGGTVAQLKPIRDSSC